MAEKHVVVDGSNIATEGRTMPSLAQLDEAVKAFVAEHPHDRVTVVVDATFGHRIDPSERDEFEEAVAAGEVISPPAGAIGRGDAFVLQIADKAGATVLSNDSFQEFHGQYDWLFAEGRLIGGKPVPGVGWIFMLRTPVRGPASRRSVRTAKKATAKKATAKKAPVKKAATKKAAAATKATGKDKAAAKAAAAARPTTDRGRKRRGRRTSVSLEPINEPLAFIEFIAEHPLGSTVEGTVEQFSSHGAYVLVNGARCYVPLKAMADPPPRRARDVMRLGETRTFVVQALDAPRRGIDLAVPGFEQLVPSDLEDTAAALELPPASPSTKGARGKSTAESTAEGIIAATGAPGSGDAVELAATETATPTTSQAATRKAVATTQAGLDMAAEEVPTVPKKTTARKTAAKRKSTAKKSPAKRKSTARKTTAKRKSTARKSTARKSTAKRKATKKKAPAKRKAAKKKSTAKRKTAKRKAPAKRKTTAKRKSTAKKR